MEKMSTALANQDAHSKRIFANHLQGQSAWQRHQEYVTRYLHVYERDKGMKRLEALAARHRDDWDVLREGHRFLRREDEANTSAEGNYEDEVARRYYSRLFKEYAVADLKHFKTGAIALRWRSEEDVVEGVGQFTCANMRCQDHHCPTTVTTLEGGGVGPETKAPKLTPYEVNFAYTEKEKGQVVQRNALVKVVLCRRCARKLNYKRDQERRREESKSRREPDGVKGNDTKGTYDDRGRAFPPLRREHVRSKRREDEKEYLLRRSRHQPRLRSASPSELRSSANA